MMKNFTLRIIIGGHGGQGVLTLGKLFSYAAIEEGLEVSSLPTYGAEMRGGYIFSTVIVSNKEIATPVVSQADVGIFLDPFSFQYLKRKVREGGLFILNSSLIKKIKEEEGKTFLKVPATEIAEKLGDNRLTNMVVAGYFAKRVHRFIPSLPKNLLSLESLTKSLSHLFSRKLIPLNEKALDLRNLKVAATW